MNALDNLPNAQLIDQVFADLVAHPEEFAGAWSAAGNAAMDAAWNAARYASRYAAWFTAESAAWGAAWSAIAALIAWDHSEKYMSMTSEELQVWCALSDDPAALLLMPYVKARELINESVAA